MNQLDHFVVAGANMADLSAWFAAASGVEPTPGGAHTGLGTRNALVALADRTYIELIAPDPEQPEPAQPRPFGIDDLGSEDRPLVTYAVAVDDIDAAVASLSTIGFEVGAIHSMSRMRPDGVELSWRLTIGGPDNPGGVRPFLIDWGDTPHPAATAATGCSISSVSLRHPDPDQISAALGKLGVEVLVVEADEPSIGLTVATPEGLLALG